MGADYGERDLAVKLLQSVLAFSSGPEVAESVFDGIELDFSLVTAGQLFG